MGLNWLVATTFQRSEGAQLGCGHSSAEAPRVRDGRLCGVHRRCNPRLHEATSKARCTEVEDGELAYPRGARRRLPASLFFHRGLVKRSLSPALAEERARSDLPLEHALRPVPIDGSDDVELARLDGLAWLSIRNGMYEVEVYVHHARRR